MKHLTTEEHASRMAGIREKLELFPVEAALTYFDDLQDLLYDTADTNGFHEGEWNAGEKIALMHSEVAEADEAHYHRLQDDKIPVPGAVAEMADVVIRVMDVTRHAGIKMGEVVRTATAAVYWGSDYEASLLGVNRALSGALEAVRAGEDPTKCYGDAIARSDAFVQRYYPSHSIWDVVVKKAIFNTTRPYKHGKKF